MKSDGLHQQTGLDAAETEQAHELAALCKQVDGIDVKLNWEMIARRKPDSNTDFCWFHDGKLIAYAPLDLFGSKGEITATVHPSFRRQGIFTQLYKAAAAWAKELKCTELLLVAYRDSASCDGAVKYLGLDYSTSEYSMAALAEEIKPLPHKGLRLTPATVERVTELAKMFGITFPGISWSIVDDLRDELERPGNSYFFAEREGAAIGHVGVAVRRGECYIRGVGILPEWRRQGFGRQMLAAVLESQLLEGTTAFSLEVATENEDALNIYKSCGFHTTTVLDYYRIP